MEFVRLNSYLNLQYRFSYLQTNHNTEVDLVIEPPRGKNILIEIKSTDSINQDFISTLIGIQKDHGSKFKAYCLSLDPVEKEIGGVHCIHWQKGIKAILGY